MSVQPQLSAVQKQCSDAILPGHRRAPTGSRQGHPRYTRGLNSRKAVGGPFGSDSRYTAKISLIFFFAHFSCVLFFFPFSFFFSLSFFLFSFFFSFFSFFFIFSCFSFFPPFIACACPLSRRSQRVYRRNTTCTMIIHVRTAHHRCQAQSVAQDAQQIHGKHGSGALLSPFPMLLIAVLAERVGCLSSGDRDRGLRIWSEREARRRWNE